MGKLAATKQENKDRLANRYNVFNASTALTPAQTHWRKTAIGEEPQSLDEFPSPWNFVTHNNQAVLSSARPPGKRRKEETDCDGDCGCGCSANKPKSNKAKKR